MTFEKLSLDDKLKQMKKAGDYKRLNRINTEAAALFSKGCLYMRHGAEMPDRFADMKRIDVMVKDAGKIIAKYTPCAVGCSACCHQAIVITKSEAVRIGEAVGRAPNIAPTYTRETAESGALSAIQAEDVNLYTAKPCPFLLDNKCSVYDVRPMICRLHHSMHVDSRPCQHDAVHDVPAMNFSQLERAFVAMEGSFEAADIRVFFPIAAGK
jgi:Fe-S-cluster containining protein